MNNESFYLTLLSNSSADYFPDNKTSNFSTKLPKSIKLDGLWSVAVVEFQYPCTMYTVQEHENVIYLIREAKMSHDAIASNVLYKTHIPATNYDNISQILTALNNNSLLHGKVKFRYDDVTKHVTTTVLEQETKSLVLSPRLSYQLGFEANVNIAKNNFGKYPANLYLGLPSQLFLYCDIISPQIVGDVMASLMRIIPLDPSKYIYGANKMHVFSPPHYLPVTRREFDTIEIDIRSSTGEKIPFQFGTSYIKLHFLRI